MMSVNRAIDLLKGSCLLLALVIIYNSMQKEAIIRGDYIVYGTVGLMSVAGIFYAFMISDRYSTIYEMQRKIEKEKEKIIDDAFEKYQKEKKEEHQGGKNVAMNSEFYSELSRKLYEQEAIKDMLDLPKNNLYAIMSSIITIIILSIAPSYAVVGYALFPVTIYFILRGLITMHLALVFTKSTNSSLTPMA